MLDPITHYFRKYNFESSKVKELICGERYVAILLDNGNIGVCATLGIKVSAPFSKNIDLENIEHRIILNAYYNALLNYNQEYSDEKDIFEEIDFKRFKNIVMVGNFKPVVKRFQEANIPLFIFDKKEDEEILLKMKDQKRFIQNADAIILTATSMFNKSFVDLIENSNERSSIYILGPSAILDGDMKMYPYVKMIFGSVFERNDMRVLNVIRANLGTRYFSPFSRKVFI